MDTKDRVQRDVTSAANETVAPASGRMSDIARIVTLTIGDILVFLIFAIIGRRSHGESAGLNAVVEIAITAAPFAIGWFVVSPFVGAFRRGLEVRPRAMVTRTSLSWLAAWPVGLLLRWLFTGRVPPLTFALITLVSNLILLLVWRWPFSLIRRAQHK